MCAEKEGFSGHICVMIFMGIRSLRMCTTTSTRSLSLMFPFRSGNLGVESKGVGVVRGAYTLGNARRERRCVAGGSSPSSFP